MIRKKERKKLPPFFGFFKKNKTKEETVHEAPQSAVFEEEAEDITLILDTQEKPQDNGFRVLREIGFAASDTVIE